MTLYWLFVVFLAIHWLADFVCQTHWQATNKSKNTGALAAHVLTYGSALAVGSFAIFCPAPLGTWALFVIANVLAHYVTDYFTSRMTARLWAKQDTHNFFVWVGLDQLFHQAMLAGTMWLAFYG